MPPIRLWELNRPEDPIDPEIDRFEANLTAMTSFKPTVLERLAVQSNSVQHGGEWFDGAGRLRIVHHRIALTPGDGCDDRNDHAFPQARRVVATW